MKRQIGLFDRPDTSRPAKRAKPTKPAKPARVEVRAHTRAAPKRRPKGKQ